MANNYFKGKIDTFEAVLVLRYEKIDLNNYFNVFCKKLINYAITEINNAEDFLIIIQDLKEPKSSFRYNNNTKDLTTEK